MIQTIATNPELARVGLAAVVPAFQSKQTTFFQMLKAQKIATKQQFERFTQEADLMLAPVVNEAQGIPTQQMETYNQKDYHWRKRGLGVMVSREKVESDQYGVFTLSNIGKKIAKAMNQTEEVLAANRINFMTSSATENLGLDGSPLCSSIGLGGGHPLESGVGNNRGVLVNGIYVDVLPSYNALMMATAELMGQVSHKGLPMPSAGPYRIICSRNYKWVFDTIVGSTQRAQTSDNDKNVAIDLISQVYWNPYLTSPGSWGLLAEDADVFHRLTFGGKTFESEYVKGKQVYAYYATEVYEYGHRDWRGFWGTTP
ncbi:MAG: hypothetical protein MUC92_04650 [Fimbriimonadaceae bacterium]|jgi:hypothetical protein|nr:hypothetical protein [Fimbriimonadaceae bacterium]